MPVSQWTPQQALADFPVETFLADFNNHTTNVLPVRFDPFPDRISGEHPESQQPVQACSIFPSRRESPPNIFGYAGIPQYQPEHIQGSYNVFGLRDDICFDRVGRLAPYSDSGNKKSHSPVNTSSSQDENAWQGRGSHIEWSSVDWSQAQKACYDANQYRFESVNTSKYQSRIEEVDAQTSIQRSAIVLRAWVGLDYTPDIIMNVRAMISELAISSGGEFDIHFLVQVKNDTLRFWEAEELYETIRRESVPKEFQGLVTLWSERQMSLIYPGPFLDNVENPSGLPTYNVLRSTYMPLQHFASMHPEYSYFWNWEVDIRYIGHYHEFFDKTRRWARSQPRKGLWERNAKYYIEARHGEWPQYVKTVRRENEDEGNEPIWGPAGGELEHHQVRIPQDVGDDWGVGEEADLITLSPIFDVEGSGWSLEKDVTGYNKSLPLPPRRAYIIASSRLSRKLLNVMHEENLQLKHNMWTEMWPSSIALHYGLKAVFAPHPVYFDRDWPLDAFAKTFNGGKHGSSGGNWSSSFVKAFEHNYRGSSWYYNSKFAGNLWRCWLGRSSADSDSACEDKDTREQRLGRMCLRSMLLHPIKY